MKLEKELELARKRNAGRLRPGKPPAVVVRIAGKRGRPRTVIGGEQGWHELRKIRPSSAKCNICGRVVSGKELHLDHNHEHGYVRGWLCHKCNSGIGMFKESPFLLGKAIEYLAHYSLLYTPKKTA
jgi:hypothetical protein